MARWPENVMEEQGRYGNVHSARRAPIRGNGGLRAAKVKPAKIRFRGHKVVGRESELVTFVKDYVGLHKILCFRVNCGAFSNQHGGFYKMTSMKGVSDFIGVHPKHPGRFFGLETKRAGETLSTDQEDFRYNVLCANGLYAVCRTPEDVVRFFEKAEAVTE